MSAETSECVDGVNYCSVFKSINMETEELEWLL
jgi:hypothetical protein